MSLSLLQEGNDVMRRVMSMRSDVQLRESRTAFGLILHGVGVQVGVRRLVKNESSDASGLGVRSRGLLTKGKND